MKLSTLHFLRPVAVTKTLVPVKEMHLYVPRSPFLSILRGPSAFGFVSFRGGGGVKLQFCGILKRNRETVPDACWDAPY